MRRDGAFSPTDARIDQCDATGARVHWRLDFAVFTAHICHVPRVPRGKLLRNKQHIALSRAHRQINLDLEGRLYLARLAARRLAAKAYCAIS